MWGALGKPRSSSEGQGLQLTLCFQAAGKGHGAACASLGAPMGVSPRGHPWVLVPRSTQRKLGGKGPEGRLSLPETHFTGEAEGHEAPVTPARISAAIPAPGVTGEDTPCPRRAATRVMSASGRAESRPQGVGGGGMGDSPPQTLPAAPSSAEPAPRRTAPPPAPQPGRTPTAQLQPQPTPEHTWNRPHVCRITHTQTHAHTCHPPPTLSLPPPNTESPWAPPQTAAWCTPGA